MITTLREVMNAEGIKFGHWHQCSKLIKLGAYTYYLNAIQVENENAVILYYEEYRYEDEEKQKSGKKVCTEYYKLDIEIIWADTDEEVKRDAQLMKKQKEAEEAKIINKAMNLLESLASVFSEMRYEQRAELNKQFKSSKDEKMVYLKNNLDSFTEEEYYLDEDDQNMIYHIYNEQQFRFKDRENHGITTIVRTEQIQSIYDCEISGKEAIVLTVGSHEYHIYRKDDETLYRAMAVLFGFSYI